MLGRLRIKVAREASYDHDLLLSVPKEIDAEALAGLSGGSLLDVVFEKALPSSVDDEILVSMCSGTVLRNRWTALKVEAFEGLLEVFAEVARLGVRVLHAQVLIRQ